MMSAGEALIGETRFHGAVACGAMWSRRGNRHCGHVGIRFRWYIHRAQQMRAVSVVNNEKVEARCDEMGLSETRIIHIRSSGHTHHA